MKATPAAPVPAPTPVRRGWAWGVVAVALLLAGVALWWIVGGAQAGVAAGAAGAALAVGAGLGWLVVPTSAAARWVERVGRPTAKVRAVVAAGLAIAAAAYLLQTAAAGDRVLRPVLHDEYVYAIQTRMAAQGKLWLGPHELGGALQSFHLISDRVYAGKYGPGTALLCAPAVWLDVPPGLAVLALTGAAVGLFYLVLCEAIDGVAGLLGAVTLTVLPVVRRVSVEVLAQGPMLFLILLALWALSRWRRGRRLGWLAVAWAAVGWGVITRPVDGASLGLAVGVGTLVATYGGRRQRRSAAESKTTPPARPVLTFFVVPLLALAPFAAVQVACNVGVTGHWWELPWSYYGKQFAPHDVPAFAPLDESRESTSAVPEIRDLERDGTIPAYRRMVEMSVGRRLAERALAPALREGLPHPLLLVLVPVGLVGLWRGGRWVLVAAAAPFLAVYANYTWVVAHYMSSAAPAVILLALVGWRTLGTTFGRAAGGGVGLAVLALAASAMPQLVREPPQDEWAFAGVLRRIDADLATVRPPAVVLFARAPGGLSTDIEPVYNVDAAWPDDAPVVRVHALGAASDRKVIAYYARPAAGPPRNVYRYDLPGGIGHPPVYLGTAAELAGRP